MPFKLPDNPSPSPHIHELADFAEILSWVLGRCSARDVQSYLGQIDDNQFNVGIDDDDLEIESLAENMIAELGCRIEACGGGYPFQLDQSGSVLVYDPGVGNPRAHLYLYLLMATRLKMTQEKIQSGIDGTKLLEELSAHVLRNYLGAEKSISTVFGTATRGGIREKVNQLCRDVGEGGQFRNIDSGSVDANDDGIDVVGWIPFPDRLPSKVSVFGQCKTGTSWSDHTTRLQPGPFIERWMSGTFVVKPIKAFFVAESADRSRWLGTCLYGGILFDRCRIVALADKLDESLTTQIQCWTQAARLRLDEWSWGRLM